MSPPGTIGVTPDSNGIVQEGDCFVLRFNADASSASTPTSITDSGCQNNVYPNGMTPGAEVGNLSPGDSRRLARLSPVLMRACSGNWQAILSVLLFRFGQSADMGREHSRCIRLRCDGGT